MNDYKYIFLAFMQLVGNRSATFFDENIETLKYANPKNDDPSIAEIRSLAEQLKQLDEAQALLV